MVGYLCDDITFAGGLTSASVRVVLPWLRCPCCVCRPVHLVCTGSHLLPNPLSDRSSLHTDSPCRRFVQKRRTVLRKLLLPRSRSLRLYSCPERGGRSRSGPGKAFSCITTRSSPSIARRAESARNARSVEARTSSSRASSRITTR